MFRANVLCFFISEEAVLYIACGPVAALNLVLRPMNILTDIDLYFVRSLRSRQSHLYLRAVLKFEEGVAAAVSVRTGRHEPSHEGGSAGVHRLRRQREERLQSRQVWQRKSHRQRSVPSCPSHPICFLIRLLIRLPFQRIATAKLTRRDFRSSTACPLSGPTWRPCSRRSCAARTSTLQGLWRTVAASAPSR